jgi:hypothetical protein
VRWRASFTAHPRRVAVRLFKPRPVAFGSGALGYTAVDEQFGTAQRVESIVASGALSASTARLVGDRAAPGEPELVRTTGAEEPEGAHRLLDIGYRIAPSGELPAPGIGMSLLVSEIAALARRRGGIERLR